MNGLENQLAALLKERKINVVYRELPINSDLIDFCSNDYLGFARSENIKKNIEKESQQSSFYNGATGSRLISGNYPYTEQLENRIATFHKTPAALLFNSGYDANLGLFSCLVSRHDTIIYDELAHASIRDGIRLSNANNYRFAHNDLDDLERKLKKAKGTIIIAIESVYSMDGDLAPLKEMVSLAEKYKAAIIVDEAHGLGVIGNKGKGLVEKLGLEEQIFARIFTYGKAMGVHGAAVVGGDLLRNYLINFARSFIYTTALPMHSLWGINAAYTELETTLNVEKLKINIHYFKQLLHPNVLGKILPSESAIQCLVLADNELIRAKSQTLLQQGFFVKEILHPTVAKGNERIRICLHSFNTKEEISNLCRVLNELFG